MLIALIRSGRLVPGATQAGHTPHRPQVVHQPLIWRDLQGELLLGLKPGPGRASVGKKGQLLRRFVLPEETVGLRVAGFLSGYIERIFI